jgi:hypothetical protein
VNLDLLVFKAEVFTRPPAFTWVIMVGPLKDVGVYTKYCIWCYQLHLSGSILIANRRCSVANTKCRPNIILPFFVNN